MMDEKQKEELINKIAEEAAKRCFEPLCDFNSDIDIGEDRIDPLLEDAARLIIATQQGSVSMIQRKFAIGYNRAVRIIDRLESSGIIERRNGSSFYTSLHFDNHDLEVRLKEFKSESENKYDAFISENEEKIDERIKYYAGIISKEKERIEIEREKEIIKAEIIERNRKKEIRRKAMEELIEENLIDVPKSRNPIPQEVKDVVWNRDSGRCVLCGSNEKLEFDHIIPFSKGGSDTARNIQLLCENCNRTKSDNI